MCPAEGSLQTGQWLLHKRQTYRWKVSYEWKKHRCSSVELSPETRENIIWQLIEQICNIDFLSIFKNRGMQPTLISITPLALVCVPIDSYVNDMNETWLRCSYRFYCLNSERPITFRRAHYIDHAYIDGFVAYVQCSVVCLSARNITASPDTFSLNDFSSNDTRWRLQ